MLLQILSAAKIFFDREIPLLRKRIPLAGVKISLVILNVDR